ncbi:MAG: addiction module protein [Xanthomonadales bacterium]|nr:addiction module protein [Xanthomonadales bacterium]
MSRPLEAIAAEALQLSEWDRELLLEQLAISLPKDPDWEAAWAQEADRREAAIASGEARWIPGDELLAQLRAKLT